MRLSRIALGATLSIGALAAATPAGAQRVTRIVAFGDSYADTGNFFALTGIPRPAVYPNGRFSNGTNFVDTMSQILGVRDDNFAIGGAFTGSGNINGIGGGFQTEYQAFLAGGGPAAFPRTDGHFGANDLLVVSIGGNDARAYERSLGVAPTPAQITGLLAGVPAQANLRIAEATAGLNALVGAGARNITYLAGDVGRLPEVNGLAIAQVGTAYSTAFNTGMQATLAGYANQGVIVNYLDLNRIGDRVIANPAAFGLQSAGACPTACVTTNPELLDRYLFYVDNLHLTSAGFAIVGRYAVRQLEAPLQLAAQGDVGLQAASSFGTTMLGRVDLSAARFGTPAGGELHFYVSGDTVAVNRPDTLRSLGYRLHNTGATAGIEYEMGNFILGGAVDYERGAAEFNTASGRVRTHAWQGGIYAGWAAGGAFVQGYAGLGWLKYRIDRTGVIDDMTAGPHGRTVTAGGRAGYLVGLGSARIGPVIGLRYARVRVDGFTEAGDPVLTLAVQPQRTDSLIGSAGIEARATLDVGGLAVQPYAQAAVEREFRGHARTIRYAETAAPTIVNQWVLPDNPDDVHGRITAGVDLSLGRRLTLQIDGNGSVGSDQGNDIGGFLALRLSL